MGVTRERTSWVGQPVIRLEDEALLRGEGRYMDDIDPVPHAGHAAILRSPFAHARVNAVDARPSARAPGRDRRAHRRRRRSPVVPVPGRRPRRAALLAAAHEVARYAGEPLAVVVARDRYIAEDAVELIEVEYEACSNP